MKIKEFSFRSVMTYVAEGKVRKEIFPCTQGPT